MADYPGVSFSNSNVKWGRDNCLYLFKKSSEIVLFLPLYWPF